MLSDVLTTITQVAMLTFVVASMAALGLGLTVRQIVQPLSDLRLLLLLLVANFVVVPAVAIGAARLLPMEEGAATAVILIGCCAGAPFLPKLAQLAHANAALSVGEMVLLMVVTVVYAPLVVPLAVEGATVDAWDIASSLIVLMLIPLAVALFVRARYEGFAKGWQPTAAQASNIALLLGIGASLLVTWREILGSIGSWIFIGTAIVLVVALAAGWLAGFGRPAGDRLVVALGTAQRNIAAAIVVATSLGGDVIVFTLVGALVIPIVLIVLAGEIGRRTAAAPVAEG